MKYILGTLGVIVLLIVAVVLIANTGGGSSEQTGEKQLKLTDFINTDADVSWTREGKIVAQEQHKAVRVTVARNERRIELLSGYDGSVEKSQSFTNTQGAYDQFMNALANAGYTRKQDARVEGPKGVCPMGNRYIYTLHENGNEKLSLWSTTCSRRDGTFGGETGLVERLFQGQIPNYTDFVRGVQF